MVHSLINQQIATKTIKKFGFSVNAVWNGQEALDYLLAEPSPTHPRPDIILMDVQMPILDGYRATHRLRHHSPYTTIAGLKDTPIVAMTASAIQGDREKCKKAGMDDYLAKPVKGKTLETMLLKWAGQSKRKARLRDLDPSADAQAHPHDENCSGNVSDPSSSIVDGIAATADRDTALAARELETHALSRLDSEGDRGLQREEAEDKARSLRDDKLLAAGTSHLSNLPNATLHQAHDEASRAPPSAALTEENISQLDRAHDEAGNNGSALFSPQIHLPSHLIGSESRDGARHRRGQPSGSSLAVQGRDSDSETASTVGSLRKMSLCQGDEGGAPGSRSWVRRSLMRNDSDRSQVTVTPGNFGKKGEKGEE